VTPLGNPVKVGTVVATLGTVQQKDFPLYLDGLGTVQAFNTVTVRSDSVREYRGLYETGFEVSWFHACDAQPGDDSWWVTLTNEALEQRDSLTKALTGHPRRLFVRWRGTVSPKMPMGAGHMGRGSRYMLVSQVISVRASDELGCTSA